MLSADDRAVEAEGAAQGHCAPGFGRGSCSPVMSPKFRSILPGQIVLVLLRRRPMQRPCCSQVACPQADVCGSQCLHPRLWPFCLLPHRLEGTCLLGGLEELRPGGVTFCTNLASRCFLSRAQTLS